MASPLKSAAAWGGECKAEERLQLSGDMAALNPSSLLAPVAPWSKSHYHHYRWEDAG